MTAVYKYRLDTEDAEKIDKFCKAADYCALEQQLGFPEILYNTKINYFYLTDNLGAIRSFCQINENFRFAHIWFGPVCDERDVFIESVRNMVDYYRHRGFWYLGIQPYRKSGYDADLIEYQLNRNVRINYLFDNDNTKSSLEIDLSKGIEEIFSAFSKGHRSAIKRAQNLGISVTEKSSDGDLSSFVKVYLKMCSAREIKNHSIEEMEKICRYLERNNSGSILLVRDAEHNILGGSVFAYQGLSVRYLLSASDPDRRDVPVTHLAIYKAIERARSENFRYFDFWGYNHFVDPEDQIYSVNRFKKGFGGYYTFLMKKMNISLIPAGFKIYYGYNRIRNNWSKAKKFIRNKSVD